MPPASPRSRRKSSTSRPNAATLCSSVDAMNQTSNHFLGAKTFAWMSEAQQKHDPLQKQQPQDRQKHSQQAVHGHATNRIAGGAASPLSGHRQQPGSPNSATSQRRLAPLAVRPATAPGNSNVPSNSAGLPPARTAGRDRPPEPDTRGARRIANVLTRSPSERLFRGSPRSPPASGPHQLASSAYPPRVWPFLTPPECVEKVDKLVSTLGDLQKLNTHTKFRIHSLRSASQGQDLFYLMLSQIVCTASDQCQTLPTFLNSLPDLDRTATSLQEYIGRCAEYPPEFVAALKEFPIRLSDHRHLPPETPYLMEFLTGGARSLQEFERHCTERKCPPLVSELHERLRIPSKLLQGLVFLAIVRRMVQTTSGPVIDECWKIFLQDTQQHEYHVSQGTYGDAKTQAVLANQYRNAIGHASATAIEPWLIHTPSRHLAGELMPVPPADVNGQYRTQWPTRYDASNPMSSIGDASNRAWHVDTSVPRNNSFVHVSASGAHHGAVANAGRDSTRALHVHEIPNKQHSAELLFPRPGYFPGPATPADPIRNALHQAKLSSPRLRLSTLADAEDAPGQWFQYVSGFCFSPEALVTGQGFQDASFDISETDLARIPREQKGKPGFPPERLLNRESRTYRLRSVKAPQLPPLADWVVSEGHWPPNVYFSCNGHRLQQRRKLHYGRDMPIDVTNYVQQGRNVIKVTSNRPGGEADQCFFAVEGVELKSTDEIKAECLQRLIPRAAAGFGGSENTHEDGQDLSVVGQTLRINLLDPLTSQLCDTPVRGSSCLHRECFDLDAFLRTREVKAPGEPSVPDDWRCPICGADARPGSLVVDGWLADVRESLAGRGQLDAKQVIVSSDGTWEAACEAAPHGSENGLGCTALV